MDINNADVAEEILERVQRSGKLLLVRVHPSRRQTKIRAWDRNLCQLEMDIAAVPEKGKANAVLTKELRSLLGCPVVLVRGQTRREKFFRIEKPLE